MSFAKVTALKASEMSWNVKVYILKITLQYNDCLVQHIKFYLFFDANISLTSICGIKNNSSSVSEDIMAKLDFKI